MPEKEKTKEEISQVDNIQQSLSERFWPGIRWETICEAEARRLLLEKIKGMGGFFKKF